MCRFGRVLQYFLRTATDKESNGGVNRPISAVHGTRKRFVAPRGLEEHHKSKGQPIAVGLEFWWWKSSTTGTYSVLASEESRLYAVAFKAPGR